MLTLLQRGSGFFRRVRRTSMSSLGALLTLIFLCAVTLSAAADTPPEDKKFDFETDEVTVDVLKPDASVVEVLTANARKSLIRIRLDFVAEIVRSAEDI